MADTLTVRVGYIPAPGEAPILDIVEQVASPEDALTVLGIAWSRVTTISVRCQHTLGSGDQCSSFVRSSAAPYLCIVHKAPRTPAQKGEAWEKNLLYQVYARMHRMTVAEQWAADNYNIAAFYAWTKTTTAMFGRIHPDAVAPFNGAIVKTDVWNAWLNKLTPTIYSKLFTHE
jgi:hypothetical protein